MALAVLSGNILFPGTLYGQVKTRLYCDYVFFIFLLQEMENLIRFMLQVDPQQRPFISDVIDRTTTVLENAKKAEISA